MKAMVIVKDEGGGTLARRAGAIMAPLTGEEGWDEAST